MSSLYTAVSGLNAAQAGLYVTGHNIANEGTAGYVRQQPLQQDFFSNNIGTNNGGYVMQVGLGTDINKVRQIRDAFLDIPYRKNVSKQAFYDTKYSAGLEIEDMLGELEGSYKMQTVISDVWDSLNEFDLNPTALETRGNFIETCKVLVDKFNTAYSNMYDYQMVLNDQVVSSVQRVNQLVKGISDLNSKIAYEEASGDNANDFRDSRNNMLDELSSIINITYYEKPDKNVDILCEGGYLLVGNVQQQVGLRYTSPQYPFVEPVFTSSTKILDYDGTGSNAKALFNFYNKPVDPKYDNDNGSLKALLVCRGMSVSNYTKSAGQIGTAATNPNYMYDNFDATQALIPQMQIQLDTLFHSIVTAINDALAPYDQATGDMAAETDRPYDLSGSQPMLELFSRTPAAYQNRWDGETYVAEDPSNPASLYTMGNVRINPAFNESNGYTKLAVGLLPQGAGADYQIEIHNKQVLDDIIAKWNSEFVGVDDEQKLTPQDFYQKIVTNLGITNNENKTFSEQQAILVEQADTKRQSIMGVSLDEEMRNMLTYQHAYNASARILNVIDAMIDKLVNGTGRVGL